MFTRRILQLIYCPFFHTLRSSIYRVEKDNVLPSAVLFMWTTTCYIFVPTVQLTDRGERHIDAIIAIVFQYIHLLKQSPPPRQLAPSILEEKKSSFLRVQTFPYFNITSLSKLIFYSFVRESRQISSGVFCQVLRDSEILAAAAAPIELYV
jgi:hypothetical protein